MLSFSNFFANIAFALGLYRSRAALPPARKQNLAVCGFFRNFAVLKKALRKAYTMEITIQIY